MSSEPGGAVEGGVWKKENRKSFSGLCLLVALLCSLATAGCGYYSFTGASIPPQFETIAIPLAEDNSLNPIPTLDEELTERLIDRFVRQTRLRLETDEATADLVLTARIDRYVNEPTAVRGDERAAENKVTLVVSVRYIDHGEERPLLERTFTSFEQYDPIVLGPDGEEQAALAVLDNIADDVFTAATSNW